MQKRQGFALITVLMMSTVLLLMVLSVIALARTDSFQAKGHHDRVAARYVAEAGLAQARQLLQADESWDEGFSDQESAFKRGVFRLKFHKAGAVVEKDDSINNLGGSSAIPGPLGLVPPRSALLQVTGTVGGYSETVTAVVSRRFQLPPATPMTASGVIDLAGPVRVDGIAGIAGEAVTAGLHSYSPLKGGPTVSWHPNVPGDRAVISGKVSATASGHAIDFGSSPSAYRVDGGFETDSLLQRPTGIDVAALVAAKTSAPSPTLPTGTATLGAGTWHRSGDVEVQGDLILEDGAEFYISGSLKVNGAIRGKGSLYVKGTTALQGDAFVEASNRVALLSGGDVTLTGFNGNEFLRSLGPEAQGHLESIETTVETMTDLIDTGSPSSIMGNLGPLDKLKHEIAARPTDRVHRTGTDNNQLGSLISLVEAQPESPTKSFVLDQMKVYHEFFYWQPSQDFASEAKAFMDNPSVHQPWALQSVLDIGANFYDEPKSVLHQVRYIVSNLGYDRLGSSFFQGLVYSNGDIRANNGVTVIGALVAEGRNGRHGDIELSQGVSVTLVEDFFSGEKPLEFRGPLTVDSWSVK